MSLIADHKILCSCNDGIGFGALSQSSPIGAQSGLDPVIVPASLVL